MSLKSPGHPGAVKLSLPSLARVLPFLLVLLGVSCGVDPLQGRVILSGSATLAPLMTQKTRQWSQAHPHVSVLVEAIGTDAGLEKLVRYNEADVALMSRPLSAPDLEAARAAGLRLMTLPLAWDAVSLVVPAASTWVHSLTRDQAARAFTTAGRWSDLDPSWPDLPIHRFVLGPRSGTGDLLAEALLGGEKERLYQGSLVQSSEDDRILARGLARVEGSVGFLGWTTIREADLPLRVLALDGVEPTPESIRTRAYGLPRQLWLVLSRGTWGVRPEVRALVRSFYRDYPAVLDGTGLIPLEAEELAAVRASIRDDL